MGSYHGKLLVEYKDGRTWIHRIDPAAPFGWTGAMGAVDPPEGMLTDFATIPHWFALVLPGPGWGRHRRYGPASVLHDWLYLAQTRPDGSPLKRREADHVLWESMRDRGVWLFYAFLIWSAVRCCGWVWWAWFRRRRLVAPLDATMPKRRIPLAIVWAILDA